MSKITGPLFKWFGSKWQASKYYPLPKHELIIEPFAGSAGYSLRHFGHRVALAESNTNIFTLWSWLINEATEPSIREIPTGVPVGTDIRTLGLGLGQSLLLKTWQRTNNVGNCWTVSPWGNSPGQWTKNTRARVASEFHCIKHWELFPEGRSLISAASDTATWFIDPPYEFNYRYGSSDMDYWEFGRDIQRLKGQVIACEAVCPKSGAIPNYLPFIDFRKTVTSRRKATNNHHSRELIYSTPYEE